MTHKFATTNIIIMQANYPICQSEDSDRQFVKIAI